MSAQAAHDIFEHRAAVLIAFELIEAGTRGGQEDDVPRLGCGVGFPDRVFERFGVDQFGATVFLGDDLRFDLCCGRSKF